MQVSLLSLREALEASWDEKTSNLAVLQKGNPALGQCYPSSWIVQHFFSETEIVEGQVWTGKSQEKHFWNILEVNGEQYHIDFTWGQFPHGSSVLSYKIRNRETLGDSQQTIERCQLLLSRVNDFLTRKRKA